MEEVCKTTRPSPPSDNKASKDVVFVLGAGVDRVLGLPLLNTLFRDLNEFVGGSGAAVNKAICAIVASSSSFSSAIAESFVKRVLIAATLAFPPSGCLPRAARISGSRCGCEAKQLLA